MILKKVKQSLKGFEYVGLKKTIDEYYYDPMRSTLKPDKNNQLSHCLRLREKMMNTQLHIKMMYLKVTNGYTLMNMKPKFRTLKC